MGARQRGWRLRRLLGLDWAAPKERITLPKHNAALYAEREESKEGSERRSEPTTRISSAHLQGQHKFASACNPSCAERRRTTFWTPCVRTRPPRSSTYRQVSKQSLSELRIDRSRQSAPFVSSGSADTQYPDDDIPINDQTDRPDPEDFRVDSCSERAQRTFSSRRLPCRVSCRGVAGAR